MQKLREYEPSLLAAGHGKMINDPVAFIELAIKEAKRNIESRKGLIDVTENRTYITKIVETAAEIADANGVQEVTLASLAQTLGVRSPSLYNHVKGLQDVRKNLGIYGIKSCITDWKKLPRINGWMKQFML